MLSERFISKLKKIADGNGLKQEDIVVFDKQDTTVPLKATLFLRGVCEPATTPDTGKNKKHTKSVNSAKELATAMDTQKKEFFHSPDAKKQAIQEILNHTSNGWGLENALVTIPNFCVTYAVKESCPQCHGAKVFVCRSCNGNGREPCSNCSSSGSIFCAYCNGRGYDSNNKPCTYCYGRTPNLGRLPCPRCSGRGYTACRACSGSAKTTCSTCRSAGFVIVNSELMCGVRTRFAADFSELPSGLRKSLDKIGIAEFGNSHADIKVKILGNDEETKTEEDYTNVIGTQEFPALEYTTNIPYAEIKMSLKGKKAFVSVTGKKGVSAGVPNFLDTPLKELLDTVQTQSNSSSALTQALQTRAFREMLSIILEKGLDRKSSLLAMKRLYAFGLSDNMILTMFKTLSDRVKETTLLARVIVSVLLVSLVSLLLYFYAANLWNSSLIQNSNFQYPVILSIVIDLAVLLCSMLVCLIVLNSSFAVGLHYIASKLNLKIKLNAKNIMPKRIGKMGFSVIFTIMFVFLSLLLLYPNNSLWVGFVLGN